MASCKKDSCCATSSCKWLIFTSELGICACQYTVYKTGVWTPKKWCNNYPTQQLLVIWSCARYKVATFWHINVKKPQYKNVGAYKINDNFALHPQNCCKSFVTGALMVYMRWCGVQTLFIAPYNIFPSQFSFLSVLNPKLKCFSSSLANVFRNIHLSVKAEKFTWWWCNSNATWIQWYPRLVCSLPIFILCISKFSREYTYQNKRLLENDTDNQPYSFPDSIGDDLLLEVHDTKGKQFGRVLVQVATIADDPVICLGPSISFKHRFCSGRLLILKLTAVW